MNSRLLIDTLIQQTTVLIAQLSTAAGLRSPLAHVADEVFLSLAQEIERQGVSRKVVADMFGLALRSYQRKVQRLEESRSVGGRTLWEAVLQYVTEQAPVRRAAVVERFRNDDELAVISVLSDLLASGLLYSSGRAENAVYGVTTDADRRALLDAEAVDARATLVWGTIFRSPGISTTELLQFTRAEASQVRDAVTRLVANGQVTKEGDTDEAPLRSAAFVIPEGSAHGWEAAVLDHYQALSTALVEKLRRRGSGGTDDESVGGTTMHFGVYSGHPFEERVRGLLKRVRADLNALWDDVAGYNQEHPVPDEAASRVTFYFGQHVRPPADPELAAELESRTRTKQEKTDR